MTRKTDKGLPQYLDAVNSDVFILSGAEDLVPVYRQLVGDTLTPVIAFRKIQDGDWSFLFESVIGGEVLGRYSFLGSGPLLFGAHFEIQGIAVKASD